MGPPPPGITYSPVEAQQPSNHPISHLTSPLLVPPHLHSSPAAHYGRGAHTFFSPMVSTHICPKYPPSPCLQQVLQQHHVGKFLTFYLLG